MTQSALVNVKTLRHAWEVPDRLDRRLGPVDGVGPTMGTDGIALAHVRKGGDDRATLLRLTVPPHNGARAGTKCAWVRRQDNVLLALLLVRCHGVLLTDWPYQGATLCR